MLCPPAWGYQRPRRHGRSSALILHDCATSSQAGFSDSSRHQSGHVGAFLAYAEGRECLLHHAATLQPSDRDVLSRTLSGCHRTTTRRQVLVLGAFGSSWAAPSGSRHFQCHAVPCRAVLRRRHADRTIAKLPYGNKHGLGVKARPIESRQPCPKAFLVSRAAENFDNLVSDNAFP